MVFRYKSCLKLPFINGCVNLIKIHIMLNSKNKKKTLKTRLVQKTIILNCNCLFICYSITLLKNLLSNQYI